MEESAEFLNCETVSLDLTTRLQLLTFHLSTHNYYYYSSHLKFHLPAPQRGDSRRQNVQSLLPVKCDCAILTVRRRISSSITPIIITSVNQQKMTQCWNIN
jgi:hypothetical protein